MSRTELEPPEPREAPFKSWAGRLIPLFIGVVVVGIVAGNFLFSDEGGRPTLSQSIADLPKGPLAGEPAEDFSVPMFDGSTFTLSDHLATDGRPLIVNFWASWCLPCRTEMPELDEVATQHTDVAVVGVAVEDSYELALGFAEEVAVSYPLGIDETDLVGASLPYFGLPTTWVIGSDGIVLRQIQGQVTADQLTEVIEKDLGL